MVIMSCFLDAKKEKFFSELWCLVFPRSIEREIQVKLWCRGSPRSVERKILVREREMLLKVMSGYFRSHERKMSHRVMESWVSQKPQKRNVR